MADSGESAGRNRLAAPIRPGTRRRLGGQIVLFDQWVRAGRLVDKRDRPTLDSWRNRPCRLFHCAYLQTASPRTNSRRVHTPRVEREKDAVMPIMAPVFREINLARIEELAQTLSDATIASIIRDETDLRIDANDVRSYRTINAAASSKMLVSRKTMRAVTRGGQDDLVSTET